MTSRRGQGAAQTWWLVAAMAMLLACGGAGAQRQNDDQSREAARTNARSSDAALRFDACKVLAKLGRQEDLPMLQSRLFDDDERVRGMAEAAIWAIWSRSGDAAADRLFVRGTEQMRDGHLRLAVETFSKLISMRPDFTEAWNKRATVYFLLGEDDLSLKDCDEVVRRNPAHFGVLAGYGQIYLRKGELQLALDYFEQALATNPNMAGVRASIEALRELMEKRGRRFI